MSGCHSFAPLQSVPVAYAAPVCQRNMPIANAAGQVIGSAKCFAGKTFGTVRCLGSKVIDKSFNAIDRTLNSAEFVFNRTRANTKSAVCNLGTGNNLRKLNCKGQRFIGNLGTGNNVRQAKGKVRSILRGGR